MNIFLVEDNEDLNYLITQTFKNMRYNIVSCKDGQEAITILDQFFNLYIIDINLPNINGLELIKKIKQTNNKAKIFIISGDSNIDTIVKAYNLGCDDYIKKPFDLRELIAKINIFFKDTITDEIELCTNCIFNKKTKLLLYKNELIKLTKKESLLLELLILHQGTIVTYDMIKEFVWANKDTSKHIRQLVSKLKKNIPCENLIQTHSSLGYSIQ